MSRLTGEVIKPEDVSYAETAAVFLKSVKSAPAIIVRPSNTTDISNAIAYAKEHNLVLSVRSGGHSNAGFSTNEGGIVIDMRKFNQIEVIDEDKGIVKLGTGATWFEVATALKPHGLAISSGDTKTVGVGGLIQGGGIGWMVRKYGLTIDTLQSAKIVTADGKVLELSERENPDLFWAIRGGGGNFGVITHVTLQAHKVEKVYSGVIAYSLENVPDLIKGWRDFMRSAPQELTTTFMVMPSMGGNPAGAIVIIVYAGNDQNAAAAAVEPLMKIGKVMHADLKMKDYADVLEDAHPPEGMKIVVKNNFVEKISDELITAIDALTHKEGFPFIVLRGLGGAMAKVPADKTAFGYRDVEAMLLVPTFMAPNVDEAGLQKAMEPWNSLAKFGKGAYIGFLSEPDEDVAGIYPEGTLKRLREVKKKYDPENVFKMCYCVG